MFKVCNQCKKEKSVNEFNKSGKDWQQPNTIGYYKSCCKECSKHYDHSIKHTVNTRYKDYKKRAKKKSLPFEIPLQEFKNITSKPCHYCGGYSINKITLQKVDFVGLDRIDSAKGYTKNNVVPCCILCNNTKWHLTKKMFLEHIKKIYEFNVK